MRNAEVWRPDELEILVQNSEKTLEELMELLPGRSYNAIANKKTRMRIHRSKGTKSEKLCDKRLSWTNEEIAILRDHGHELTISELERLIPNHKRPAIYNYAKRHGYRVKPGKRGTRVRVYSDQQKEYVAYFYPRKGGLFCARALGLSLDNVRYLARMVGVRKNK